MNFESRAAAASAVYNQGLENVKTRPVPEGQKFQPGERVRIADDLGQAMAHFPSGVLATVEYTYAHAYWGEDVKSYSLNVDGHGSVAWFHESQLERAQLEG